MTAERIPMPDEASVRAHVRAMTGGTETAGAGDLYVEAVRLRDALIAGKAFHAGYLAGLEIAKTIVQGGDALAEAERVIQEGAS